MNNGTTAKAKEKNVFPYGHAVQKNINLAATAGNVFHTSSYIIHVIKFTANVTYM